MSNNPNIYTSDAEQRDIDKAEAAINWIDSLPKRISLILLGGAYAHDLHTDTEDTNRALELITEALSDLFAKDRNRLQETVGYTPEPKLSPVDEILNALKPFKARAITNPETIKQVMGAV